jgi:hypothetical protein
VGTLLLGLVEVYASDTQRYFTIDADRHKTLQAAAAVAALHVAGS